MAASRNLIHSLSLFRKLPRYVLAPVPLPLFQPLLRHIVTQVARRHSDLFNRLGDNKYKTYLIDPVNMPFVLKLRPDPKQPSLRAFSRSTMQGSDASIAGTFLTLMEMIDGQQDGDALFFTRDIIVRGDTEAVVALRNALDDLDGNLLDDIASLFGPLARLILHALRNIKVR